MPRQSVTEQQAEAPFEGPVPPPVQTGPGLPAPAALPGGGGLKGRARFDQLMRNAPGVFSGKLFGGMSYADWLDSLPDDPADPEYQSLLQAEKAKIKNESTVTGAAKSVFGMPEDPHAVGGYLKGKVRPPNKTAGKIDIDTQKQPEVIPTDAELIQQQKQADKNQKLAIKNYQQPVLRGGPITDNDIYSGEQTDPYLQQFFSENGIILNQQDKSMALRSGNYVYMGSETNTGLGATRDVYLYGKDAQAAVTTNLGADTIKKIQTQLGLTVTGKIDDTIEKAWDNAVEQATRYAMTGQRVTVRELFDIQIASMVAAKNSAGAGGALPMEDYDYYRAMQNILGDTSGVGNG